MWRLKTEIKPSLPSPFHPARHTMRTKTGMLAGAAGAVCAAEALVSPRSNGPIVDLGYATYQGYYNSTYGLDIWKR